MNTFNLYRENAVHVIFFKVQEVSYWSTLIHCTRLPVQMYFENLTVVNDLIMSQILARSAAEETTVLLAGQCYITGARIVSDALVFQAHEPRLATGSIDRVYLYIVDLAKR